MSDLDKEAVELYEKLLSSDEDISIRDFYEKYASDAFKENAKKMEERRMRQYEKGIIVG